MYHHKETYTGIHCEYLWWCSMDTRDAIYGCLLLNPIHN